jgi:flagellar L-ring protein precursor FlgH
MKKHILKITLILLFIGLYPVYRGDAQFIQNSSRSLFSDVKAFKIGDAIMVLIMEETQANNNAATSQGRETNVGGSVSAGANGNEFDADASLGTGFDFQGKGQTSRQENIRSRLSARVTEVETNGNLKIEGTRTTKINGETQTIVIRGIVRPVDVSPSNSIYSYSILDLTLLIEGDGEVSMVQEPGLITKFLRFLF